MITYLIVRFSSIGDIVLTTPVVRCLKQQVDGSRIIYLTKSAYEPVIKHNPYIDRYILFNRSIAEVLQSLSDEKIDYIVDLHQNLRTNLLKRRLNIAAFSFSKLNWEKWLLTNFKIDKLPDKHIVDRYLETIQVFDVENDQKGLDYFLSDEDQVEIELSGIPGNEPYLAVVVGANHYTKQIPSSMIARIIDEVDKPVVLLGGPDDTPKANEIIGMAHVRKPINMCGKNTINQSAYMVKQAQCVLTPDTGLMHIAAAFKKNIISVWGNTDPRFGMYPYLPGQDSATFEVTGLSCRPCSKIGYKKCPKKHFNCMHKQDVQAIITNIKQLFMQST